MTATNGLSRAASWLQTSITVRLITIGILILVLLIPVALVTDLIDERYDRQREAVQEVSAKWARAQTISGVFLTVPFVETRRVFDRDRNLYVDEVVTRFTHLLPEDLRIEGSVVPEVRYRGTYEVVVYRSELRLTGSFSPVAIDAALGERRHLRGRARLGMGISDPRGIQRAVAADWGEQRVILDPGLLTTDIANSGISVTVELPPEGTTAAIPFSIPLSLNGSERLAVVPLGKTTDVNLSATWGAPSFDGQFLPDERTITKDRFDAHWNVLHVNRSYPQQFVGARHDVRESRLGVSLLVPVDQYLKTTRASKYALLFIALTFLIFFFAQTLLGVRVHPVQYLLVGIALCVFYTLLISVAEHVGFTPAYGLAGVAVTAMVALYSRSVFGRWRIAGLVGGLLALTYLFIYVIIQLEIYALLIGSLGLFGVLAAVMFLSRRIAWYTKPVAAADPPIRP